jgi:hypothetical protein
MRKIKRYFTERQQRRYDQHLGSIVREVERVLNSRYLAWNYEHMLQFVEGNGLFWGTPNERAAVVKQYFSGLMRVGVADLLQDQYRLDGVAGTFVIDCRYGTVHIALPPLLIDFIRSGSTSTPTSSRLRRRLEAEEV